MSCNRDIFSPQYAEYLNMIANRRAINRSVLPSFTPILNSLSVTESRAGVYAPVYVKGSNFLPNGTTFIQFGELGYIQASYYSSFNLSFIVPLNAEPGEHQVKVVNLYNGNFCPPINQSYPGVLNFSNPITYTIIA